MPVHRTASTGFARSPEEYERGRPGYPAAAIGWLSKRLRLGPGRVVVDVAAGTGKLTRSLMSTGADVVAVEPLAEMRALIGAGARALEGTAEELPLADASADAVTVGQAFHWFDADAALAEIHRVLRPSGALALVWNRRLDDPVNQSVEAIIAPHRGDTPAHRSPAWRTALEQTQLFAPFEEREFPNVQTLDAEALAARVASISFIAALPGTERDRVLDAVRALAADGPVDVPYATEVQVADRRS
jgi:ubiquinone/menaquinone biosynthesis C-methylase UbiE